MAGQCPLCERSGEYASGFCILHHTALMNLENQYDSWYKAFVSSLTKDEYFDRLQSRSETGQAVKAVIEHIRWKARPT